STLPGDEHRHRGRRPGAADLSATEICMVQHNACHIVSLSLTSQARLMRLICIASPLRILTHHETLGFARSTTLQEGPDVPYTGGPASRGGAAGACRHSPRPRTHGRGLCGAAWLHADVDCPVGSRHEPCAPYGPLARLECCRAPRAVTGL